MTRPAWLAACAAVMVSCSQFGSGDAGDAAEDSPHADVQPDTAHDVAERDDGPIPFDVIEDAIRDATADAVDAITPDVTEPPVDVADITTPPGDTGPRAGDALAAGRGERDPGTGARSCPGFHLPLSNEAALVPADDRWVARRQPMKTQSTTATDCRCKACGALLAKRDRDGLTIRRGDMQGAVVSVLTDERVEWSFQSVTLASSGGNPVFTLRNATFRGYVPNGSFLTVPNALR